MSDIAISLDVHGSIASHQRAQALARIIARAVSELDKELETGGVRLRGTDMARIINGASFGKYEAATRDALASIKGAESYEFLDRAAAGSLDERCFVADKMIDSIYWDVFMHTTNTLEMSSNARVDAWRKQVEGAVNTPEYTIDNINNVHRNMYEERGNILKERVSEIFNSLSWNHRTNNPAMFDKRLIIKLGSHFDGHKLHHKILRLDDTMRILMGATRCSGKEGYGGIFSFWGNPEQQEYTSEMFTIKRYKNLSFHLTFSELGLDAVSRLNEVMSDGNALPRARRGKA